MREIKFRAWGRFGDELKDDFVYDWQDSIFPEYVGFDGGKAFIVEQYTGLRDKNGREIYEGDITEGSMFGPADNERLLVCWNEDGWGAAVVKHPRKAVGWVFGSISTALSNHAVVGNIHENPDMLKGNG